MTVSLEELWIDEGKFKEVMKKVWVAHLSLPPGELQRIKDKLVDIDEKYQELELRRIQWLLDLMNSMTTGVFEYHKLYWNKTIKKEEPAKPIIPDHNKERHRLNQLRSFATMDEKITWNLNHIANCKCGGWHIPSQVKKEIEKRISKA